MIGFLHYLQSTKWMACLGFVVVTTPSAFCTWCMWRIVTLPFPSKFFVWGDEWFYSTFQRMLLFLSDELTGVEIYLSGDVGKMVQKQRSALFLCNHQCSVDWLLASSLGLRQGSVGSVYYILKHTLFYIPFYGLHLKGHGCIYIRRKQFDSGHTINQLSKLYQHNKKFWLVIFPEGTRFNRNSPETIKKSHEYAIAHGLPLFDHVLLPHTKGFEICLKELKNHLDGIYDITLAYKRHSFCSNSHSVTRECPSLIDLLKGECKEIHVNIKYFNADDILAISKAPQDWLMSRFQIKNQLLQKFYGEGKLLDGKTVRNDQSIIQTLPSFVFFTAMNVAFLSTNNGRKLYSLSVVCGVLFSIVAWTFKL